MRRGKRSDSRVGVGADWPQTSHHQRAGVVLLDLSPAGALTGDLFAPVAPAGAARRARMLEVLDGVNGRWGRGTLRYLAEGGAGAQPWRMRRERLSPGYTTDWGGIAGGGGVRASKLAPSVGGGRFRSAMGPIRR